MSKTLPEMNPHISRDDAVGNPRLWAVKYRKHPKNRNLAYTFDREIITDVFGKTVLVPLNYLKEIYDTMRTPKNLTLVIEKARQARISEFLINSSIYLCDVLPYFSMLYVFPDDKLGRRFLLKRIDPAIDWSPHLSRMIADGGVSNIERKKKSTSVDSLDLKKLRDSWFYMLASQSKTSSHSPDGDGVVFDEYDKHDISKEASFVSTTDDSDIKLKAYVSTPTIPDFGIDARYKISSRGRWIVNCPNCQHDFEMNSEYFFGNGIKVLEEPREIDGATRIYVCPGCGEEITDEEKQTRGRFVHDDPALKAVNNIGFRFSSMILPHMSADVISNDFVSMLVQPGGRKEFYNHKLGEASTGDETQIHFTRAVMMDCQDKNRTWIDRGSGTFIGIDWGKDTHVTVWKFHNEKLHLLNYIEIPHDPRPLANAKKVLEILPYFNPTHVIADFGSGQEQNKYLYERIHEIVWFAINSTSMKDLEPEWLKKTRTVRYELITSYTTYSSWYAAGLIVLPRLDARLERFIMHHTNSSLIDPNKTLTNDSEGHKTHFAPVSKKLPRYVAKKGPIHLLSSSLFGWLVKMGTRKDNFSFSDALEAETSESNEFSTSMPQTLFDENGNPKTVFDRANETAKTEGDYIKTWQP